MNWRVNGYVDLINSLLRANCVFKKASSLESKHNSAVAKESGVHGFFFWVCVLSFRFRVKPTRLFFTSVMWWMDMIVRHEVETSFKLLVFLRLLRMKVENQKIFKFSFQLTLQLGKEEKLKVINWWNGHLKWFGFSSIMLILICICFAFQERSWIQTWIPQGRKMCVPRWLWHTFLMFATTLFFISFFLFGSFVQVSTYY